MRILFSDASTARVLEDSQPGQIGNDGIRGRDGILRGDSRTESLRAGRFGADGVVATAFW